MSKTKIVTLKQLLKILPQHKGKTVGYITGCFDVLHVGHVGLFQFAKKHVDILIVGLDTDESVKLTKGDNRPINPQKHRCLVLAALMCVDYVLPLTFKHNHETLAAPKYHDQIVSRIKPNYLITSLTTDRFHHDKKRRAKLLGLKLLSYKAKRPTSTTHIIAEVFKSQL